MNDLISVIIPTYNSASTLHRCLESIKNQTYKNIEIIIVDNFSIDKTKEIAKIYGAKVIEDSSIRSKARNIAVGYSKGKYIISIDSDMELTPRVIEECIEKSKKYSSVIISEISYGTGFWAECKSLERKCYIGDEDIEAARFFDRELFHNINGYNPILEFGEDWDIHQRIKNEGFRFGRIESRIMHNEGNISLWQIIKKRYKYGKTIRNYIKTNPKNFSNQSKFIRPAFIKNWNMLIKDPRICFGMFFMKSVEYYFMGMGYIKSIIENL